MNDTNINLLWMILLGQITRNKSTKLISTFLWSFVYLYSFRSKVFISYFIHHRSVVSFSDYDNIEEDIDLQNQPQ